MTEQHAAELSYPARLRGMSVPLARGATYVSGQWSVLHESRVISREPDDFTRARDRILSWQMHRDAGVRVAPSRGAARGDVRERAARDAATHRFTVTQGDRVKLSIGVGPIMIPAPCEIITVIDSDREAGFAYGTLAGHPEQGEEAFLVRMTDQGTVVGSVAAFSRPVPWALMGAPVLQRAQRIIAKRYLSSMAPRSNGA